MVKCVVTGCPNRTTSPLWNMNRPQKTFFSFPTDPARVKVWLAALREMDKLDSKEHYLICEDHFLKEDITTNGVKSDAIPIMSPYLDGSIGMISSWEAETQDVAEEEEGDEEEEHAGVVVEVEDDSAPTQLPETELPPLGLDRSPSIISLPKDPDPSEIPETKDLGSKQKMREIVKSRSGVSLPLQCLQLLQMLPGVSLELSHVCEILQADKRRISDISSVLDGINLVEKQRNRVKWIGGSNHTSSLALQNIQSEVKNLALMEEELDGLIRDVLRQLLEMTNNRQNAELAYVTLDDIRGLKAFEEQTVMVVKAPDETVLKVPEPSEDFIQIHVKSWNGPVTVLTCDIEAEDTTAERNIGFSSLEESRMKTSPLQGEAMDSSHPVVPSDVTSS